LPKSGKVFVSVRNSDKPTAVRVGRDLVDLGFTLVATKGTAAALAEAGIAVSQVNKVAEGRPHIVDMIKNGEIALIINTVDEKRSAIADSRSIRTMAVQQRVTYFTTIAGALAACMGMRHMESPVPYDLQGLHKRLH
jgi:carbamoyl-phosphate synthase large subunit